jgi:hypothetical protein
MAEPVKGKRLRRSITPARLYREIQRAMEAHFIEDPKTSTIQELLDGLLEDVLEDALGDTE